MKIVELFNNKENFENSLEPYLIAEAGVNHEGNMDTAKRLIDEAKEGGADAIKFQTYKAESLASRNSPSYWDTTKEPATSQYLLFKKFDKFWKNEYEELKLYCDQADIEFMSTPFDFESAEFLNDLMNVFKISSSDITNKPFIEFMADFRKPLILSTGASYLEEISDAVNWIESKSVPLALLHCVLNYPTLDENANLGMIKDLKKRFPECLIGYSDHTLPGKMKILETAVLFGSVILEKHFTHDKKLPGNDHYHAMDKEDIKLFKRRIKDLLKITGSCSKSPLPTEEISRKNARRSIVAKRMIKKGEVFKKEDLTFKRPAFGISPKELSTLLEAKAVRDINKDDIIYPEDINRE